MKDSYKIHEIAQLCGIGVDSLRYYERLGILTPSRDTNGYRLYALKDMYKLNVIRDLRQLGFSMSQIKAYLDHQSVDNTLSMLRQEETLLQERLAETQRRIRRLRQRVSDLHAARSIEAGHCQILSLPERRCIQVSQRITRDEEMDFMIKKLHRDHEDRIQDLGNQVFGAVFSMEDIAHGATNVYSSVFFVLEDQDAPWDYVLPAGPYASCYYRGSYVQNAQQLRRLLQYLKVQGRTPAGDPFELYAIDNMDTMQEEEFLTEIQIPLAP